MAKRLDFAKIAKQQRADKRWQARCHPVSFKGSKYWAIEAARNTANTQKGNKS